MDRYRLTIEVFSDLDPSSLLDQLQELELDETEVDLESATVTDLGYTKQDVGTETLWNGRMFKRA